MAEGDIPTLMEAIRRLHGVDGKWIEVINVRQYVNRRLIWKGDVHVFAVLHPLASRCFAWSDSGAKGQPSIRAVLQVPPVESASDAVRVDLIRQERLKPG